MVAIGVVSAWRTKLPTLTLAALMRPVIGARDGAIAELDFQIFEQALVGFDGRAEDVGLGLGVVEIDHRGGALGDQIGVARDVALGAGELRAVARDSAFGLRDLRLDGAAVEGEQQLALLDLGAVAEMHRR